jgi:AhpD family alkylhydroperoxidase
MLDWSVYRTQLASTFAEIAKADPDRMKGCRTLAASRSTQAGQAGQATLDPETRELVALAVAVTLRCGGCIATHVELARKRGATQEEITDALGVAVTVNAGRRSCTRRARAMRSTPARRPRGRPGRDRGTRPPRAALWEARKVGTGQLRGHLRRGVAINCAP